MAVAAPFAGRLAQRLASRARAQALLRTWWLPLLLLAAGAVAFRLERKPAASGAPVPTRDALAAEPLDLGALVGALLVVGGLVAALPLVARRLQSAARGKGTLEVVEARPLRGGHSLLVVAVEGRRLLLGTAQGGVTLLCELGESGAPFAARLADELRHPKPPEAAPR